MWTGWESFRSSKGEKAKARATRHCTRHQARTTRYGQGCDQCPASTRALNVAADNGNAKGETPWAVAALRNILSVTS